LANRVHYVLHSKRSITLTIRFTFTLRRPRFLSHLPRRRSPHRLSALFSELDGVKPYLTLGRKNRFLFDELFDVSSLEDDGSLVEIGSKRHHMSQVCRISSPLEISPFCIRTDTRGACRVIPFSTLIPASTHGRAGFSYPRVHILPPPSRGRNTDFADTRAAFNNLPAKPPTALAKE
jgi:alpha-ketoglutarate-dependent 2,4-dichlorophenoxyacetate dioxygenase